MIVPGCSYGLNPTVCCRSSSEHLPILSRIVDVLTGVPTAFRLSSTTPAIATAGFCLNAVDITTFSFFYHAHMLCMTFRRPTFHLTTQNTAEGYRAVVPDNTSADMATADGDASRGVCYTLLLFAIDSIVASLYLTLVTNHRRGYVWHAKPGDFAWREWCQYYFAIMAPARWLA